ncbi:MAG: hypothetical protein EXR81_01640 [Gammaproteobacteria bacterium]|nr:hypothetical protein [Gammaproteobacteria bacterium]
MSYEVCDETTDESTPLIPRKDEPAFALFLTSFVTPLIKDKILNRLSIVEKSVTYPGRMSLQSDRCSVIEEVLKKVAEYTSGQTDLDGVDMGYYTTFVLALTTGTPQERKYYGLYTQRIMKRYDLMQPLAQMLFAPQAPATKGDAIVTPTKTQEQGLEVELQTLFRNIAIYSYDLNAAIAAAEAGDKSKQQRLSKKILYGSLKSLYVIFTILGGWSGIKGGMNVPHTLGYDSAPEGIKIVCGFLGFLCWFALFTANMHSVSKLPITGTTRRETSLLIAKAGAKFTLGLYCSIPSAFFALKNSVWVVQYFSSSASDINQTILSSVAYGSSLTINTVLNLGIFSLMLNFPAVIAEFMAGVNPQGYSGKLVYLIAILFLLVSLGTGVANSLPYVSPSNPLPPFPPFDALNPSAETTYAINVTADLPNAILGSLLLANGKAPLAIFTHPGMSLGTRFAGFLLGITATLIYFNFIYSLFNDDGPEAYLKNYNTPNIYCFAQILAALGNFTVYSNLPHELAQTFGSKEPVRPLFPALKKNNESPV